MSVDLAEGTEPLTADVRLRVRAALRYLETTRPGNRYAALLAVWRACTDLEGLGDWRPNDARRTFCSVPLSLRVALRMTFKLLERDPQAITASAAVTAGAHLLTLTERRGGVGKGATYRGKPQPTVCGLCREAGHNRRTCRSAGTTAFTAPSPASSEASDE